MGVDDMDEAQASEAAAKPKQEAKDDARFGAWVEGDGENADMDADMEEGEEAEEDPDEALIHEKAIGKGKFRVSQSIGVCICACLLSVACC